jgi:hypothetical protein
MTASKAILQVLSLGTAGEFVGLLLHGLDQHSAGELNANVQKTDLADLLAHRAPGWDCKCRGAVFQ